MAAVGGSFQDWISAPLPDFRAADASLPTVEYTRADHYEDLLMARPGIPKRATNSHHRRLIRKQRPSTGKKLSGRDIMGKFAGSGLARRRRPASDD